MKTLCVVILCLISFSDIKAQEHASEYATAQKLFNAKDYSHALPVFLNLFPADTLNATLNYQIGMCYYSSRSQKVKSLSYFERTVSRFSDEEQLRAEHIPDKIFKLLGDAYQLTYDFDRALFNYEKYRNLLNDSKLSDQRALEEINWKMDMCRVGKALNGLADTPINIKKEKRPASKSAGFSGYSSVISLDQSKMTFTFSRNAIKFEGRDEDSRFFEEFIKPVQADTPMADGKPVKFEKINFNEANVATSFDGQIILNYKDDKGTANLYLSCLNGNSWTFPESTSKPINSGGWEAEECISADGNVMFFTSDRKGGYGGKDIYVCYKTEDGEWGKAKNLGPNINTPFDEEAPFIHPDGITLYFSSNGRRQIGHFDIYTSTYSLNDWSQPQWVGFPSDTSRKEELPVEETIVIQKKKNDRKKTVVKKVNKNRDNYLISFSNPNGAPLTLLKGQFTYVGTAGKNEPVDITITDNLSGKVCNVYTSDSLTQKFTLLLPPGRNNNIAYKKNRTLPYSENIDLIVKNDIYEKREQIVLPEISEDSRIALNNIFFEQGKVTLNQTSTVALKDLEKFLKSNPNLTVELSSIVVVKQDLKMNARLAQDRADVLKNYLCNSGLPKEKIIAKGSAMKIKRSPQKKAGEYYSLTILEKQAPKDLSAGQSIRK